MTFRFGRRWVLLGLGVVLLGAVLLSIWSVRPVAFDSAEWKSRVDVRQRMVADFQARHLREGMLIYEVEALLGRDESELWDDLDGFEIRYRLDEERPWLNQLRGFVGMGRLEPKALRIRFDAQSRLVGSSIGPFYSDEG